LVTLKCTKCGKEYELDEGESISNYICIECGGDLDYKNPSLRKMDSPKKQSKSKKPVKTIIISVIAVLVVILVLLLAFTNIIPLGNQIIAANNSTENSTPSIPNSTYTGHGITFNYPAGWIQMYNLDAPSRWGFGNPVVAFFEPEGNKTESDSITTYFYIKQRGVTSLDQMIEAYRIDIAEIGQTYVSHRNITVNGMRAVELIKEWNVNGRPYRAITAHIEVIPGSLYYRIGCVTPQDQWNESLPKFEMVIYSFKPA
jgi:hypothetical protein